MKDKIYAFLAKKTTVEQLITACMITFLATVAGIILWLLILAGGWSNLVNTLKFSQVLAVIDRVYVGDADITEVSDAAFSAMVNQLGDRWSYYMTREEYERYKQVQSNHYTGIGITIAQSDDGWTIAAVLEGSPAEQAGMQVGMVLLEVNDVVLTDETAAEISAMMQEDPDCIKIIAAASDGTKHMFELAMKVLYSSPVAYELKEHEVGYIQLKNFDESAAEETIAATEKLLEQGAQALVFDVRNNGGGYVTELCDILDYLLPEGEIFISVDENGKEEITRSDEVSLAVPMAVLVNENSYSAAEFFAAALQEYDAATVVGSKTTGKNRSQTNMILADGSAVHISSKRYLTPNRIDLTEQGGLIPDIELPIGEEDTQLAAALSLFSK